MSPERFVKGESERTNDLDRAKQPYRRTLGLDVTRRSTHRRHRHQFRVQDREMADKLPTAYQGVAEASLKRLKTDVIALFYQPRIDPSCRSKTSRE